MIHEATSITWSHDTAPCSLGLLPCAKASSSLSRWPAAPQWGCLLPPRKSHAHIREEQAGRPQPCSFPGEKRWLNRTGFCLVLSVLCKGKNPNAAGLHLRSSSKIPAHTRYRLGAITQSHALSCDRSVLCACWFHMLKPYPHPPPPNVTVFGDRTLKLRSVVEMWQNDDKVLFWPKRSTRLRGLWAVKSVLFFTHQIFHF